MFNGRNGIKSLKSSKTNTFLCLNLGGSSGSRVTSWILIRRQVPLDLKSSARVHGAYLTYSGAGRLPGTFGCRSAAFLSTLMRRTALVFSNTAFVSCLLGLSATCARWMNNRQARSGIYVTYLQRVLQSPCLSWNTRRRCRIAASVPRGAQDISGHVRKWNALPLFRVGVADVKCRGVLHNVHFRKGTAVAEVARRAR